MLKKLYKHLKRFLSLFIIENTTNKNLRWIGVPTICPNQKAKDEFTLTILNDLEHNIKIK